MKTEQELLDEIQRVVQNYWKSFHETDTDWTIFQRVMSRLGVLLWVLYDSGYHEVCPYCGSIMECDTVDVGVGYQQCGPYYCDSCHASEIHPNDYGVVEISDDERATGFYRNRISPMANTCNGELVKHHEDAKKLYEAGVLDNCKPGDYNEKTV